MARKLEETDTYKRAAPRPPNRLVLCFDGTGNMYQANTSDTNIIKLLEMLDRSSPRQMHYYQPGIGTYTTDSSVNKNLFGRIQSSISQTIDAGIGTTFDAHVMAGYRFLMRYYMEGDRIYIFGFSRGAFTARFVARMVAHVGLLSMGNEEMVPFAFKLYQDYEMNSKDWKPYMVRFRNAFCRHNTADEVAESAVGGFQVHFLGLFDTVGSVGTLDRGLVTPPIIHATAAYVRHAVATDERRVKFKAALLAQDETVKDDQDVKEVWFPGNHGDVGGGWNAEAEPETRYWLPKRLWDALCASLKKKKTEDDKKKTELSTEHDRFQLSDIALKWMMDELLDTEMKHFKLNRQLRKDREAFKELADKDEVLAWSDNKNIYLDRYNKSGQEQAITGFMHDTMAVGGGSPVSKAMFWNFMEYLPGIWRWEYYQSADQYGWWYKTFVWTQRKFAWMKFWKSKHTKEQDKKAKGPEKFPAWKQTYFPLNQGQTRDIPEGTLIHDSVRERMSRYNSYRPVNDVFASAHEKRCLSLAVKDDPMEHGMEVHGGVYFRHTTKNVADHETDRIFEIRLG